MGLFRQEVVYMTYLQTGLPPTQRGCMCAPALCKNAHALCKYAHLSAEYHLKIKKSHLKIPFLFSLWKNEPIW